MISEMRILEVDDVATNMILIRHILEKSHPGYEILFASSEEEGFDFSIKNSKTDLVVYTVICQNFSDVIYCKFNLCGSFVPIKGYRNKLNQLNYELLIREESERRRTDGYLGYGIGPILSMTNRKRSSFLDFCQLNKTDRIEKKIIEFVDLISNAVLEIRSLIYEFGLPILHGSGLIPAIRFNLAQREGKHGIFTEIISHVSHLKTNADSRILLYRVVLKLHVNVFMVADASQVKVRPKLAFDVSHNSVSDDGKGLNYNSETQSAPKGGFGLICVEEELDSIQSSLTSGSRLQPGIHAVEKIPLRE